jgi:hypothetical protein
MDESAHLDAAFPRMRVPCNVIMSCLKMMFVWSVSSEARGRNLHLLLRRWPPGESMVVTLGIDGMMKQLHYEIEILHNN